MKNNNTINDNINTNANDNDNPSDNTNDNTNTGHDQKDLPEIIPKEELTFSGMDRLKMIFGAYLAMLPALIALILTFLIVYFLVSR